MSFSIITPTFNPGPWIRCCVESVRDQDVSVEHIVQDGGSVDGTAAYLHSDPRINCSVEADKGMYDAINRGWAKAGGDILLHLNADEQLLPGALRAVEGCFRENPDTDVVICGTVICSPTGSLLAYRKPMRPPLSLLLTSHHPVPSCSIFLRRTSFTDRSYLYDPAFRIVSDALLMIDILRSGKTITLLDEFTSAFFWTGENLGLFQSETLKRENSYQMSLAPTWLRLMKPLIRPAFHMQKLMRGHYFQKTISYKVYTPESPTERKTFEVSKPSGVYRPEATQRAHE